ncbi:MAG TPA: arylsulfatase [Planctomycetaceae bacterium]|nr:arylsulfatase [Planctomycetaceae bacterium]
MNKAVLKNLIAASIVLGQLLLLDAAKASSPNIVLVMADDVGIEGVGCYGGTSYATPNIDRLAMEGVRFTQAYAQPLCTPTRVELMTGKYNHRNWKYFGILDPAQKTFGHAMQSLGYRTAIFGKWQLYSYDPPELPGASKRRGTGMHPKDAGFDEYALFHALHTEDKGSRYANPTMLEGTATGTGVLKTYADRYGEDIWVEKILSFFDSHRDTPKFVYYPMALPHWPFEPTPDSEDWNPRETPAPDVKYQKDMIEYMDTVVGRLVDGLQHRGQREDTIIIFYSDNGTHLSVRSEMQDGRTIRGGKATSQQTGIHVPLIVNWSGHFEPSITDALIDASDFFPTILDLADVPAKAVPDSVSKELDGTSFAPVLRGEKTQHRESAFFWYDPRPGWDKENFHRSVFAVNHTHKYFRDGRLLRLADLPLSERLVPREKWTATDQAAASDLEAFIEATMQGTPEPPLVDAYGKPTQNTLEKIQSMNLPNGPIGHQ